MSKIVDWAWRKPVVCRISGEHVPDPADLFCDDALCLRCERVYDDAAAQLHRQHRIVARSKARRPKAQRPALRRRLVGQD